TAMMEEARAMGLMLKQGWKPKRTIIFCAWDGEEPGLLGSTEWAEAHADELLQKGAAYINSDNSGRGFLNVEGSHTLEKFVNAVARDIEDPETKMTVAQRLRLRRASGGGEGNAVQAAAGSEFRIAALGSGSDYSAFIDHLGIASLNLGFGGEDRSGIYHSDYDDFYWYTHFSDTSFVYGRALAQIAGTAVLRLADAQVLPYDFVALASTVQDYVSDLQRLVRTEQDETTERNREIQDGVFAATSDPWHPTSAP